MRPSRTRTSISKGWERGWRGGERAKCVIGRRERSCLSGSTLQRACCTHITHSPTEPPLPVSVFPPQGPSAIAAPPVEHRHGPQHRGGTVARGIWLRPPDPPPPTQCGVPGGHCLRHRPECSGVQCSGDCSLLWHRLHTRQHHLPGTGVQWCRGDGLLLPRPCGAAGARRR